MRTLGYEACFSLARSEKFTHACGEQDDQTSNAERTKSSRPVPAGEEHEG